MNRETSIRAATIAPWADANPLPIWAQGHETLLAAIVAERPDINVFDNGMSRFGGEEFAGLNAAKLRRIYSEWVDQRIAGNLQGDAYETMRADVIATPDADRLVRMLLAVGS